MTISNNKPRGILASRSGDIGNALTLSSMRDVNIMQIQAYLPRMTSKWDKINVYVLNSAVILVRAGHHADGILNSAKPRPVAVGASIKH